MIPYWSQGERIAVDVELIQLPTHANPIPIGKHTTLVVDTSALASKSSSILDKVDFAQKASPAASA